MFYKTCGLGVVESILVPRSLYRSYGTLVSSETLFYSPIFGRGKIRIMPQAD